MKSSLRKILGLLGGIWLLAAPADLLSKPKPSPTWLKKVVFTTKPGHFPLPKTQELHYTAGWAGLTAGEINVLFANDAAQQTLHATGKTEGLARLLFSLDADCTAVCDPKTLAPRQATISETYSDESRTTTQEFDADKVVRVRTAKPATKSDGKRKIILLPHVLDLQSSLLFLRSQPLKVGDKIVFLTYATGSPYLAKVSVVKQEQISVRAGKFTALRLQLDLTGIDKNLELKTYKKARDILAWISDDAERTFLKFTAELGAGHVFVELDK